MPDPMPLILPWSQIALRLALATVASFVIGMNREEGHPAGVRTTMLVCLAATLAMLQVNLLMLVTGKAANSFIVMDLMRLPLGILSGIGFIGAGVILKGTHTVRGVTTAATMWYVTVLGLLFGGGQLAVGIVASVGGIGILWGLKRAERLMPRQHSATLHLSLTSAAPPEAVLREHIQKAGCSIASWCATYEPAAVLSSLDCTLRWRERGFTVPHTPEAIALLRTLPGIVSVAWKA